MHVLFVHKNFPAQFGHIGGHLLRHRGYKCTFVSETPPGRVGGIYKIQYQVKNGATSDTHYCTRTFENAVSHAHAVYEALRPRRHHIRPDLIVGHSGFGSTLFLPELFPDIPLLNYFEYYYHGRGADLGFRPDFPATEADLLRSRARNAMILLDLEACRAGYAPTRFQHSLLPDAYKNKVRILHDGIPTDVWKREEIDVLEVGDLKIGPETPVVTYVSRGFESMRGFDVFMQVAKRVCDAHPDVIFLVVGTERVCYGGDLKKIEAKSFKEHVLAQADYDLSRIHFVGRVPPRTLVRIFSRSDAHVYLTVPFVLSWSLLNAMACECAVMASDTAPVREVIRHGVNGLLCDFFDVGGLAATVLEVLKKPAEYRKELGKAARRTIESTYGMEVMMPQIIDFYEQVAARGC